MQGGVVGQQAVGRFAVLPETFPVVGDDLDDQRLVQGQAGVGEETTDLGVHGGDLTHVRILRKAILEGGRRGIAGMGIEEMDPQKERLVAAEAVEPAPRQVEGGAARPLADHACLLLTVFAELIVVDLESLVEAVAPFEDRGGKEGPGAKAALMQVLRQGERIRRQTMATVGAYAVLRRVLPGHQAGMGGQGDGRDGVGPFHDDALLSQG